MLLQIMNNKWIKLGIEDWFAAVHHVGTKQFKKNSSTLTTFVNYCDHKKIKGQNFRTIERALEVARYVSKGINPNTAIRIAWEMYPLVKNESN